MAIGRPALGVSERRLRSPTDAPSRGASTHTSMPRRDKSVAWQHRRLRGGAWHCPGRRGPGGCSAATCAVPRAGLGWCGGGVACASTERCVRRDDRIRARPLRSVGAEPGAGCDVPPDSFRKGVPHPKTRFQTSTTPSPPPPRKKGHSSEGGESHSPADGVQAPTHRPPKCHDGERARAHRLPSVAHARGM